MEFKTDITEEELDKVADETIKTIQEINQFFNLGEIEIDEFEGEDQELILDLNGDDLSILIGKHGKTIQALQQIINTISSKRLGFKYPVSIDVHGYKNRQKDRLEDMAINLANKAINTNKEVHMKPMTPYERRLIHIALKDQDAVTTYSEGEGRNRHLVIKPL